jgi:hypothetical protein
MAGDLPHSLQFAVATTSKVQVKFSLEQAMKAQRRSRGIAILFLYPGTKWGGWSTPRPDRFIPGKETRYPLYRRLGGPQGPVWTAAKNLAPNGIRSAEVFPQLAAEMKRKPYAVY